MKKLYCDCCEKEIAKEPERFNEYQGYFHKNLSTFPFKVKVEVVSFQFNTTDFHICKDCFNDAIKQAIST